MSTEATGAAAPGLDLEVGMMGMGMDIEMDDSTIAVVHPAQLQLQADTDTENSKPTGLHSPPDSNNDNDLKLDGSDSELSDLDDAITADFREVEERQQKEKEKEQENEQRQEQEQQQKQEQEPEEDDIGEISPDHWSGTVPVFRPTMHQFKDFKRFMTKIDSYGMKSGIVKVIPPQEWKDSLPALDELVKQVKVKEPIKQDIMGSNGTYRQVNILHQRSYNLPQWRQLCDQSEHQPPARRGERRANADKPKPAPRTRAAASTTTTSSPSTRKGRGRRGRATRGRAKQDAAKEGTVDPEERPMTPVSPKPDADKEANEDKVVESVEQDPGIKEEDDDCDDTPTVRRMGGFSRQAKPKMQSTSARRKYSKREGSAKIDEAAFKDWDYRMDVSDYTPERCEELERIYWKTLTYAPPLYGADLMGTLFDESTECWNLNKLPNLLDVLGTKVPGVNTAYLYLGMWKATFAWHLEDVDLYSINYLHFGAPKQWYSISQGDARRFEAAMKSIWPTDAKACDQFLRHKAFLISPAHLQQHYNIKVNRVVSYPGEFVVTYPYGYHSGYNLGYNCAEAVNFALDSWLPMGKIAKKCECAQAQDSVWVDVYEIERKLRGESTEYEETEDEDDDDEEDEDELTGLPSPPSSHAVRIRAPGKKRKRVTIGKDGKVKAKKIRLRVKSHAEPPCCLCPNDIPDAEILPTDDGRKAHRMCALYLPETYIETVDGKEVVTNAANINKARLDLKCLYCRSKKGACFQCSQKKCARSYHATCAAAAGVFIEEAEVPVFGEDGTEYKEQAFEFSCRFHRTKRDKKLDGDALEENSRVQDAAAALKKGEICQMQYYKGDIFAGVVVENRRDERTLLLDIIPNGDRVEVDSKWLLLPDPADFRLPKASANALPMPTTKKAKDKLNAKRQVDEVPRAEDSFVDGFTWAEFHTCDAEECKNKTQVKVDMAKQDQVWHYLGKTSTESKAQYTEDPRKPQHNLKSNFLDSIPKPPPPPRPQPRTSYGATHAPQAGLGGAQKTDKPYVYKPRKPVQTNYASPYTSYQFVPRNGPPGQQLSFGSDPRYNSQSSYATATFMPVAAKPGLPMQNITPGHPPAGSGQHNMSHILQQQQVGPQPRIAPQQPLQYAWQKYSFFQVYHNRDSSRYRTPYSTWGGFTNGYEGSLRNYLSSKPEALFKDRRLSFGLGGGLQGLTRPPVHTYTSSTGSSASSIYSSSHSRSKSGAASPSSSHGSGHKPSSMSPPPFPSKAHRRLPSAPSAPLHPAIRPQFGAAWQKTYNHNIDHTTQGKAKGTTTPSQSSGLGPPLPVHPNTAGNSSATATGAQPQHMNGHKTSTSTPSPAPYSIEQENGVHQSPEQQLQHQLRRISDPRRSPFRRPHSSSRGSSRGHTPRSSLSQVPLFPPQSPPRALKQEHRTPQQTPDYSLAANGVSVREFPEVADVQPDSMALVERMMMNLRRASEKGATGA